MISDIEQREVQECGAPRSGKCTKNSDVGGGGERPRNDSHRCSGKPTSWWEEQGQVPADHIQRLHEGPTDQRCKGEALVAWYHDNHPNRKCLINVTVLILSNYNLLIKSVYRYLVMHWICKRIVSKSVREIWAHSFSQLCF